MKQVEPRPEPVTEPDPKPVEKPPETVAAIEKKPDAISEAIDEAKETPAEEATKLPDTAPAPQARPKPAEAQTAKAPDRKAAEKPVKEASSKARSDETGSIEDDIAAVLNKDKAKGGGRKKSTQEAALGGKKTTGAKLSQGEMDALRGQLSNCWSLPAGLEDGSGLRVSIRFNVDTFGKVEGAPQIETPSGNTFSMKAPCARYANAIAGPESARSETDIWSEIVVNFDPSEMF